MIILRAHTYRVLQHQSRKEWRTPSLAQPKTVFGHENHVRFRLTARLNDGHIAWRGWCDDREDADVFLDALCRHVVLSSPIPRELWDLPSPAWFPGFGEGLSYEFATQIFVVSGASQTSPADWNNASNTVEGLGGGGSGAIRASGAHATGGGGGEWRKISNFNIATPGTDSFNYTIGPGGTAVSSNVTTNGNDGTQTTFNTTSLVAKPGLKGGTATGSVNGGAGGTAGTGAAGNSDGGRGGNLTGSFGSGASGGGGAGGSTGAGNQGVDSTSTGSNVTTNGGSGDAGAGGAAGTTGGGTGGAGGNGTEWDASHGSGGGGAGGAGGGSSTGGSGGNYGGGGGAAQGATATTQTSGAGAQGIIVLIYTPAAGGTGNYLFNIAGLH